MGWNALGKMLFLLISAVTVAAVLEQFRVSSVIGHLLGGMLVGPGVRASWAAGTPTSSGSR